MLLSIMSAIISAILVAEAFLPQQWRAEGDIIIAASLFLILARLLSRYLRPGIEFFALTRDEREGDSPYIREMRKEAKRMEELDA